DIPGEVDEAFLLGTVGRVIGGVEVGDEDAIEALEHLLKDRPLACWSVYVYDILKICERPDIPVVPPDLGLGLVSMDKGPKPEPLLQSLVCRAIPLRRPRLNPAQHLIAKREAEDLGKALIHILVREAQPYVVIDRPTNQVVTEP